MERFRPNLVVSGSSRSSLLPWDEDNWSECSLLSSSSMSSSFQFQDVTLRLVKPCSRCTIPLINPTTGEIEKEEPTRTLKLVRSGELLPRVMEGGKYPKRAKQFFFGWNCVVAPLSSHEDHSERPADKDGDTKARDDDDSGFRRIRVGDKVKVKRKSPLLSSEMEKS